jgi:hypothetical protein
MWRQRAGTGAGLELSLLRRALECGRQSAGSTSAARIQVETRSRRFTTPPCWPVSCMPRITKNIWSRSRAVHKAHDVGIGSADAGIDGNLGQVVPGRPLGCTAFSTDARPTLPPGRRRARQMRSSWTECASHRRPESARATRLRACPGRAAERSAGPLPSAPPACRPVRR